VKPGASERLLLICANGRRTKRNEKSRAVGNFPGFPTHVSVFFFIDILHTREQAFVMTRSARFADETCTETAFELIYDAHAIKRPTAALYNIKYRTSERTPVSRLGRPSERLSGISSPARTAAKSYVVWRVPNAHDDFRRTRRFPFRSHDLRNRPRETFFVTIERFSAYVVFVVRRLIENVDVFLVVRTTFNRPKH